MGKEDDDALKEIIYNRSDTQRADDHIASEALQTIFWKSVRGLGSGSRRIANIVLNKLRISRSSR